MYQSMHQQEHGKLGRGYVTSKPQPGRTHAMKGAHVLTASAREAPVSRAAQNPRFSESQALREAAKTHRPCNWSTSYQSDFHGWKAASVHRNIADDTFGRNVTARGGVRELESEKHQSYRNTFKYNQIRKNRVQTTYGRDFGETGHVPGQRLSKSRDGLGAQTTAATARELFAGTTKQLAATRVPGYSGYIPHSTNNTHQVQGSLFPVLKDNLRDTYRHDMPGYCGHKPTAVVNDSGPRDPLSLQVHDNNRYQVSLLLDSMIPGKTQEMVVRPSGIH